LGNIPSGQERGSMCRFFWTVSQVVRKEGSMQVPFGQYPKWLGKREECRFLLGNIPSDQEIGAQVPLYSLF
ncbi:hypothetical protein P4K96_29270, partial [Bacillus cereus]|nr:hypothetical protein [Bacillus cereus]